MDERRYDLVEVDVDDGEVAQLPGSAPAGAQLPCSLALEVADFVKLILSGPIWSAQVALAFPVVYRFSAALLYGCAAWAVPSSNRWFRGPAVTTTCSRVRWRAPSSSTS